MKDLCIEQLIPGNNEYQKVQPLRPQNVWFTDSYYVFVLADSLAVWQKSKIDTLTCQTFDEWVDSATQRICFSDFGTVHPVLYHVEEMHDKRLHLFFRAEARFFLLEYVDGKSAILRSAQLDKKPLYPCANAKGEVAYSTADNELFLMDTQLQSRLVYRSQKPFRIDYTPSRDELGITELIHWSPDGRRLAFYMNDDSLVAEYPLVRIEEPMAHVDMIKYPMAGTDSETTRIGVLDLVSGAVVIVDCARDPVIPEASRTMNHRFSYLTSLSWSPDGEHLYLCELERTQQYYQAKQYSAVTGDMEVFLFEESDERYVEPEHPFIQQDEALYFLSQRTGHQHIYRYDLKSRTIEALTQGTWDVQEIIRVYSNGLFYYSTENSPLDKSVYRLDKAGVRTPLVDGGGRQQIFMSEDVEEYVISLHRMDSVGTVILQGCPIPVCDPLCDYRKPVKHVGYLEKEGEKIYYKITEPLERKEEGKCPVVFYVYGGPHVQLVQNSWESGTKGFEEMMALAGYYVFYVDPHGSANRGHTFESVIYQHINKPQLDDYDYALDWFFQKWGDRADRNKMVLYGWSFGGYMTLSMLLKSRYTFRLGVAGGAVVDWRYYEVMYTERYMGVRTMQTEKYYDHCDIKKSWRRLKSPVYLIHCDNDPVVLWQHTLSLLKQANQKSKNGHWVDYYIYPGHPHNVRGEERIQLMKKIKLLIDRNIK